MDDKDIQENSIMNMTSNDITSAELKSLEERKFKIKGKIFNTYCFLPNNIFYYFSAGIFLTSVTCIGAIVGFSTTLASAKKFDPVSFNKGLIGSKELNKMETGASLALRALGWGTLYAVIGTTSLAYGLWKLSGASNVSFIIKYTVFKLSHRYSDLKCHLYKFLLF